MTKEAKLTAAMRILPEWKDYDNEIRKLQQKIDSGILDPESAESTDSIGKRVCVFLELNNLELIIVSSLFQWPMMFIQSYDLTAVLLTKLLDLDT